jgi:plastocyanin
VQTRPLTPPPGVGDTRRSDSKGGPASSVRLSTERKDDMARRVVILIGVAALAVAGCGDDEEEPAAEGTATEEAATDEAAGQPAATLEVSESDFEIDPKNATVDEDGLIQFEITNDPGSEAEHQLVIEAQGEIPQSSDLMDPGESTTFTAELDSGKYVWYCPISNHRELGMEGTLTVGGGG